MYKQVKPSYGTIQCSSVHSIFFSLILFLLLGQCGNQVRRWESLLLVEPVYVGVPFHAHSCLFIFPAFLFIDWSKILGNDLSRTWN
jgi:hypothetical protein